MSRIQLLQVTSTIGLSIRQELVKVHGGHFCATYQALSLTTIYYYIFAFFREPRDTESGHFTQLVWDSSTQLGVGVTRSESTGKFYVVMKYWPPGNYIGKYTQHVKPPAQ